MSLGVSGILGRTRGCRQGLLPRRGPQGIVLGPVSRSESPSSGLRFGRPLLWSAGWANAAGPPPLVPPSLARPSPAPSAALSLLFREPSPPSGPRTRVHSTLYPLPYVASGGDARRALGPPVCWGGSASFYRSWPGEETWAGGWHALGSTGGGNQWALLRGVFKTLVLTLEHRRSKALLAGG